MDLSTITLILGALVALITICSTILGVGWKLGQIASGIRISQIERRVERLEKNQGDIE